MDAASIWDQWMHDPLVGRLVGLALGLVLVAVARGFVQRLVTQRIEDNDARYRVRKMVTFTAYGLGIAVVLLVFSDRLAGITVALGVAGAGIAFALQEVIASTAGWIAVSFGGFFRIGDRVQLGGIKGDVIDIGILRTTIMEVGEWVQGDLYTGRVVRVANSFVFKEPVFNYSGDFPFLWDEIRVPVKFGSDRARARALLEKAGAEIAGSFSAEAAAAWREVAARYRVEPAVLEPVVTLVANDNWIEYTLRYPVHFRSRRGVKDRLWSRVLDEVDATGGAVGLASATFHLVEAPPLEVRIRP